MGSEDNRLREKWQDYSGRNAAAAEHDFYETFQQEFVGTKYQIRSKPKEFSKIYVDFPLDPKTLSEIYTPPEAITKHGVFPDYAIDNLESNKTIYIEVKRQDGWVEGGKRSDGRGNAHERSCKFFTPGLLSILRSKSNISEPHLPFYTVFMGDIARDPCRVREITCWYGNYNCNFFFWRDRNETESLIHHFKTCIGPIIE